MNTGNGILILVLSIAFFGVLGFTFFKIAVEIASWAKNQKEKFVPTIEKMSLEDKTRLIFKIILYYAVIPILILYFIDGKWVFEESVEGIIGSIVLAFIIGKILFFVESHSGGIKEGTKGLLTLAFGGLMFIGFIWIILKILGMTIRFLISF